MIRIITAFFFVVSLAQASEINEKIKFNVEKYQLDNGLTVLLHEDHTMPLISYHQWFRVGSSYEKPGRTGLAHFFEHLMFKGTPKYPKGEIDRIIEMNGGTKNAFTTEDYTGYYTNLPSNKLELVIDVESDRMRQLMFEQKEIDSEREVVKEERRMRYENSVYGSLFEQIRSTLYKTSPYRWPVIGYMADLNATKLDELKDFYNRYYAPNNAVVVIAGDINISKAKSLIEKYYGGLKRQEIPPFQPTLESEQKSPRYSNLERDVQSVTLAMVYPGANAFSDDVYALDIMSGILGSGSSSRLYKRLVYKNQLMTQVSMSASNDKLSGEISILAALKPGANVARSISLVKAELEQVKNNLVTDQELKKIKTQIKLSYLRGLQTMASRANALANAEIMFGDYKKIFTDLEKYESVTLEDVKRVANKYINPNKLNLVQMIPKSNSEKNVGE